MWHIHHHRVSNGPSEGENSQHDRSLYPLLPRHERYVEICVSFCSVLERFIMAMKAKISFLFHTGAAVCVVAWERPPSVLYADLFEPCGTLHAKVILGGEYLEWETRPLQLKPGEEGLITGVTALWLSTLRIRRHQAQQRCWLIKL